MTPSSRSRDGIASVPRPGGFIRPTLDRAQRAMSAIMRGRFDDAEKHISALDESTALDRTWKEFLKGKLLSARGEFSKAETPLRKAAAMAIEFALPTPTNRRESDQESEDSDDDMADRVLAIRLSATAWEAVGVALRRQDRPEKAVRAHWIALSLREECGSFDEQWESALSLGLACDFTRDATRAETWFHRALHFAEQATENREAKQAEVWTHLSALLSRSDRHEKAVSAARTAGDLWRSHDLGSLEVGRSDVRLAYTLVRRGESLIADRPSDAARVLDEALALLESAGERLAAFGPPAAGDTARCAELVDFARRLQSACSV